MKTTLSPAAFAILLLIAFLSPRPIPASAQDATPQPGTLAYDKGVWITLLRNNTSIRREVRHLENGVEAVTESDDPAIAALIRDHAFAMKARMTARARVRVWDPVFLELFEHADKVRLHIEATDKGVRIVETSDDPHTLMLLRSHAAGLSDFVREGIAVSGKATPYWHERTIWTPIEEAGFTTEQTQQRDLALAARDDMAKALLARLEAALLEGGPAGAIAVCKEEAPQIAAATAEARAVRIGRTSHRLRNPGNRPPEWAESLLTDQPGEARFVAGNDGSLGAAFPIRLAPNCLACHGAPEAIAPDALAALATAYPDDRATGFRIGDIRGWFWVETPHASPAPQPAPAPAPAR